MAQTALVHILSTLHNASTLKTLSHYQASLLGNGEEMSNHSWRLALLILLLGKELNIEIDMQKALALALVHDLDIQSLAQNGKTSFSPSVGEENVGTDISWGIDLYRLFDEYEKQESSESKFVKALETIETFLRLNEQGTDIYVPQVFHEDYFDMASSSFEKALKIYPELVGFIESMKEQLDRKYDNPQGKWEEIIL